MIPLTFDLFIYRPPLSLNIFMEWPAFLSLGIPAALSLFIEWGSFELAAGIVSQMGDISLATHGIFVSTAGLLYLIPLSIAVSTATLLGNMLGSSDPSSAQSIMYLGIIVDGSVGLFISFMMFTFGHYWGAIYTTDENVLTMCRAMLPVMSFYLFVDSTKCITTTLLRSTGRPNITVYGNMFACFVLMLPGGYALAIYFRLGVQGMWLAMALAWLLVTVAYMTVLIRTDWSKEADNANKRNTSSTGSSNTSSLSVTPSTSTSGIQLLDRHVCFSEDSTSSLLDDQNRTKNEVFESQFVENFETGEIYSAAI